MTEQSYFKDAHGKYTFPGQRECDPCENADQFDCFTPVREYTIIFDDKHNGYPTAYVRYCLQCASLATANHPANISSIEPSRVVGLEVDGWRLWDDGQIEVSGLEGWEAPFGADPVPLEILELAEEANLELWGRSWMWSETTPHASEVLPFRNLLPVAYIWEREEDGHTYWRRNDGWMAAPTLTNGNPDWDAAGYVSDFILSEEEKKELNEWLQEKP